LIIGIGRPTRRIDWKEQTSGLTRFVSDIPIDGLLIARFLRSPHPHAAIQSIDTSEAS
jgi:xanthine dehydrogenase molybdenum-binding subunit